MTGLLALLALQQGFTTPPAGDTTGYWQQRVRYTIVAHLDEAAQKISARGILRYVNNSPDTLRELYLHQYLNAFRPGSRWSAADAREGRVRFQHLREPDFGYERFTAPVRVNGVAATVRYPGAPDSTVAHVTLPAALRPGDSVEVTLEWDARPSTLPRRQGRRGRHWDLAQWYPRIAPYDRGGWQYNALQPAGEFYGEFGEYDVTLVVRDDQVIGATGVPVAGDPGWERARRRGTVFPASTAYGSALLERIGGAEVPTVTVPPGHTTVRFLARDVHHFAWSASPDYRYEGGVYARTPPPGRVRAWDSVAVHVLYQPGDDTTWGGGRVVQRTMNSLRWLESIFGRYAYPQMTVLHRIEGGGTEFPMMQMNGSPSQGLNLHEGGHVWVHGILANNEWRSGWLDEGLTSYQTEWAQGLTPQERVREGIVDRFVEPTGYRARAVTPRMSRFDAIGLQQAVADMQGGSEPIGTVAHEFRDFGTYNQMIYTRAQVMYGQLRDALGDSAWVAFLHDYYDRWALKHVDERAMRGSAERVSGRELGWFFDQWVHRTGLMDYALADVRQARDGARWVTRATVVRRGAYAHPIAVGVRTTSGWVTAPVGDPGATRQTVEIATAGEPLEVRLDPHHYSWDWDRRNDVTSARARLNVDWPFLRQADRERPLVLVRPTGWYSEPGGITPGLQARGSYLDLVDRWDVGFASSTKSGGGTSSALQGWARLSNPYFVGMTRPAMGWTFGAARLDDILTLDISHERERTRANERTRDRWALRYTDARGVELLPPLWTTVNVLDLGYDGRVVRDLSRGPLFIDLTLAAGTHQFDVNYGKLEVAAGRVLAFGEAALGIRGYGGWAHHTPPQRAIFLSVDDPLSTFENHWWRPRGALLKRDDLIGLPVGGAGLRGFDWRIPAWRVVSLNVDASRQLLAVARPSHAVALRLHAFGDAAYSESLSEEMEPLGDAGLGLGVSLRLFDRTVRFRLDAPLYVSHPRFAIGEQAPDARWAPRWVLTFGDLWPD